jgi:hypothetical protein
VVGLGGWGRTFTTGATTGARIDATGVATLLTTGARAPKTGSRRPRLTMGMFRDRMSMIQKSDCASWRGLPCAAGDDDEEVRWWGRERDGSYIGESIWTLLYAVVISHCDCVSLFPSPLSRFLSRLRLNGVRDALPLL